MDIPLNDKQLEGVEATDGPVLVIAGAGSGKTRLLTARIIHLISEKDIPPSQILAVTFTNKAASEMQERVSRALNCVGFAARKSSGGVIGMPFYNISPSSPFPHISTFHSMCVRILRQEISITPYQNAFLIYDEDDQLVLIKNCLKKLDLSDSRYSPKSILYQINSAKCASLEPHEIQSQNSFDFYTKAFVRIYEEYQKELFKNNAIDFGEIITLTYRLLRDNPSTLEKYQELFRFIHVDEYQDTNRAQYLLIKLIASKYQNLCVVGDEDQSIYKWRGADIQNILDFEKDYPAAKVVVLEENYRSTKTIITASSHLISNNTSRKPKNLWTQNEAGQLIQQYQVSDEKTEAELVVSQLKQSCSQGPVSFNDIAIFYRTNAQSRAFEDVLRREKIPYKVIGGFKFYERKEIKDVLAYFKVLINSQDSVSLKRIINVPQRSIGKTTLEKIEKIAFEKNLHFKEALSESLRDKLLPKATQNKIENFIKLLEELRKAITVHILSEFLDVVLEKTQYLTELKTENTIEAQARIENLQELKHVLMEFEQDKTDKQATSLLPLFIENVSLVGDGKQEFLPQGSVTMMTLHMSKGLEFPIVFMVGQEEGLFPSYRTYEDSDDVEEIEEERRLCYVGMTRARWKLYMTHAVFRRVHGNIVYQKPSRFLNEIPEKYKNFIDLSKNRYSTFWPLSR